MNRILVAAAVTLGSWAACAEQGSPMSSDRITITQSTVGNLDGARVGVTRVSESEEYTLADGTKKTGTCARLAVENGPSMTVGVGSTFSLQAHSYEVTAVANTAPRGTVTIHRVR